MASYCQIDNLQPGDIVIWHGQEDLSGLLPDTMGMVVDNNPVSRESQVVLIQFYGGGDGNAGPLQYYRHELDFFLEAGEIRIQHG